MSLERKTVHCECHSAEHQVSFVILEHEPDVVYMEIHLTTYRSFWKRLVYGLKYAFGYKSKYGAWDEIILSDKKLAEIKTFLVQFDKK